MIRRGRARLAPGLLVVLAGVATFALPAAGFPRALGLSPLVLNHLSQGVVVPYYIDHPSEAPQPLQASFEQLRRIKGTRPLVPVAAPRSPSVATPVFTRDTSGLPQNEESITACRQDARFVLGGTNDLRGLFAPESSITGWQYSTNGGFGLAKEGLLPPVGEFRPSGDPADVSGTVSLGNASCAFYASSLAFTISSDLSAGTSGVALYKTTPATLDSASCRDTATLTDPDCWPAGAMVATNAAGHMIDKEWIHVGISGGQQYVWAVWTDFDLTSPPFTAAIMASRCIDDLSGCTPPQLISGSDPDVHFADVTIGPDGRTYVTWSEIQGEVADISQTFIHKLRIAPAGSTVFGPTQTVAIETKPVPFGGHLQANRFQIATYPKSDVALIGSTPRIFVIWEACTERIFTGGELCEYPVIKLRWSDDDGATWTEHVVSVAGVNYFPTISVDPVSNRVLTSWYTNRFDPFQNAQDVEVAVFPAGSPPGVSRARVTSLSNEVEADPYLRGGFIGDYFEAYAYNNQAWVHFNANYRQVAIQGGLPINQQDNFIARFP